MKKVILFLLIVIITSCSTAHYFVGAVCTGKKETTDINGRKKYVTTFKTENRKIVERTDFETYIKAQPGKRIYLEVKQKRFDKVFDND